VTAVAAGDPAAALARLEEGVQAHPRSAPLLACLAAVRARQGKDEEAQRLAERAAAEDPTLPQPIKLVGDVHYRAGRHEAAAAWYARAVELAPALGPDVWLRIGNVRLRQGDRAGAVDAWRQALRLQPDHAIARGNLDALGALGGS
jgi:cellulose synthase operon protein C